MSSQPQAALVDAQFGPQANAYVASAVHAQGEDLERFAAIVREARPARVLDLGCGGGHMSYAAAPFAGEVVASDLSPAMLAAVAAEAARRGIGNITTAETVAERLPFADASFDIVATRLSAHHWSDLAAGLAEARRVCKTGRIAVFIDTVSPGKPQLDTFLQAFEILRDASHVRSYSISEWVAAVGKAGFAVGEISERRLAIDFPSWIARMRTPELHAQAIRSLQSRVAEETRAYFEIAADGSFAFDAMMLEAKAA